jgi:hypothetical protein
MTTAAENKAPSLEEITEPLHEELLELGFLPGTSKLSQPTRVMRYERGDFGIDVYVARRHFPGTTSSYGGRDFSIPSHDILYMQISRVTEPDVLTVFYEGDKLIREGAEPTRDDLRSFILGQGSPKDVAGSLSGAESKYYISTKEPITPSEVAGQILGSYDPKNSSGLVVQTDSPGDPIAWLRSKNLYDHNRPAFNVRMTGEPRLIGPDNNLDGGVQGQYFTVTFVPPVIAALYNGKEMHNAVREVAGNLGK